MSKEAVDVLKDAFVKNQIGIEIVAKRFLGNIILGGANPTCHQQYICPGKSRIKGFYNILRLVADRCNRNNFKSLPGKLCCHPGGIGIDNLSNKDFIANSYDFYFHFHILNSCKIKKLFRFFTPHPRSRY
ncbi:hypothetical protein SDC9_165041 [bioreactor metagenome]|uniref:Uncharacterized protein n=1 Tax=bioreactor metagenome TaxID=1076179 RepID=A0A645FV54_9ZZZZ